MPVRAKFKVHSKEELAGGMTTITLFPVTGDSEENHTFWQYTPSGEIKLNCLNQLAADQFVVGQEYYIDFTAASAV